MHKVIAILRLLLSPLLVFGLATAGAAQSTGGSSRPERPHRNWTDSPSTPAQQATSPDDDTAASALPEASGDHAATPIPFAAESLLETLGNSTLLRERLLATLPVLAAVGMVSLVPLAVLMTTCYVRVVIVLTLLRQALGNQQIPPPTVITALALAITLVVMGPVWQQSYDSAIASGWSVDQIPDARTWQRATQPICQFLSRQIDAMGNAEDVWLFLQHASPPIPSPQTYDDVPLRVLLPAFLVSELKTAFLIGFQIYLPLLIVDLVVATVLGSMSLITVPPAMVSLPLKLLLFVSVDGWHLVVASLMESFR